jgi:hypothetical protein
VERSISQFAYCTDEYVKTGKDPIRRTLRGFSQAVKFLRDSPQEGARIAMKTLTWSEPAALRAHEISGPVFSMDGRIDVETVRFMPNTLVELGVLKKRLPVEDHFTHEFTPVRL